MSDIAVIGAGAWGLALAAQAVRAGNAVRLWANTAPRGAVPPGVRLVRELPDADVALLVVPMQHLRRVAQGLPGTGALVACCKGVETASGLLPLEVLTEIRPHHPAAVLTGPNFAHEVAAGLPAAAVVASDAADLRTEIAERLATSGFRLYGSDDPVGAQIGGAAKNVIAIAAGAVIGAGLGENARAALVTRGLAEIGRLAVALGGRAETVAGLSGLGDLLLTCTGAASRNYALGLALGRGEALAGILATRDGVTEGVATAPALRLRARKAGIDMPITEAVASVLEGQQTLREAIDQLLARRRRDE